MFNFSKVSSLALGLALIGGLGLSNLASANTAERGRPTARSSNCWWKVVRIGCNRIASRNMALKTCKRIVSPRVVRIA